MIFKKILCTDKEWKLRWKLKSIQGKNGEKENLIGRNLIEVEYLEVMSLKVYSKMNWQVYKFIEKIWKKDSTEW